MSTSAGRWMRRLLTVLLPACATVLSSGVPAQAHPFGDPQTATITAKHDVVTVEWRVGGIDDLTLLGVQLGVLPSDRVMLDGAINFVDGDAEAVADSAEFRDYLLDRISVSADGRECTGAVVEVGDLEDDGARLAYSCTRPVTSASVTVKTLTDLHPAYRTLATGPRGQRAVYESAVDTHEWALASGGGNVESADAVPLTTTQDDLGRSAAAQLGAVLAVVLLILTAWAVVVRRRRAHHPSTPTL